VRELSHVIERAVLWSKGQDLTPEHLSLTRPAEPVAAVPEESMAVAEPTGEFPAAAQNLPPAGMTLDQWEKTMLEQALRETGGNQTRAAQRLGISRDTLRYRLKKYGIAG
jgi:DNA-binding NtrC family response regulator